MVRAEALAAFPAMALKVSWTGGTQTKKGVIAIGQATSG